jgi:hypothetical protein
MIRPPALPASPVGVVAFTAVSVCLALQASPARAEIAAAADPRIDRAAFAPTARGAAPGTLVFSSEELLVLGLSYVLPESTELAVRFLLPVVGAGAGIVSLKRPVYNGDRLQLALLAGFAGVDATDFSATFLGGGLASGICLDRACESLVSAWAALGHGRHTSKEQGRVTDSLPCWCSGPTCCWPSARTSS